MQAMSTCWAGSSLSLELQAAWQPLWATQHSLKSGLRPQCVNARCTAGHRDSENHTYLVQA